MGERLSLESLVAQAQRGDVEAFTSLVTRLQDMAVGYAFSLVRDFGVAEDVAQEAFLDAFLRLTMLREPKAFPAWLRRIVRTRAIRMTRRRSPIAVTLEAARPSEDVEPTLDEQISLRELQRSVAEAINKLAEPQAIALSLHYMGGYSYKEIANFLEVPLSTVKSRIHAARSRLREPLQRVLREDLWGSRPSKDMEFSARVTEAVRKAVLADAEGNVFIITERV